MFADPPRPGVPQPAGRSVLAYGNLCIQKRLRIAETMEIGPSSYALVLDLFVASGVHFGEIAKIDWTRSANTVFVQGVLRRAACRAHQGPLSL